MKNLFTILLAVLGVFGTALAQTYVIPNGFYHIRNAKNQAFSIDLADRNTTNGNNIRLHDNNLSSAQLWYVQNVPGGRIVIRNAGELNFVIDLEDFKAYFDLHFSRRFQSKMDS